VTNTELVTARDLDAWCTDDCAPFTLPIIIRQLILATAPVVEITMPARAAGVRQRGWDGLVRSDVRDPHVPLGLSGWELGTGEPPRDKAQRDYRNRTQHPCGVDRATTTFIAVTARTWDGRKTWRDARRRHGVWADVRIYDATDLELWMERAPSAHVRISEMLGRERRDAQTPDAWWAAWSRQTDPDLPRAFLLAGRDGATAALTGALLQPPQVITVTAASQTEALAVVCASLVDDGPEVAPFRARALVVSAEGAWGRLADSATPLVLIPTFEEPDVATALENGHRVVVPISRDVPPRGHLVDVPALDRLAGAEAFLRERPDLGRTRADRYAAHASRNVISFRRTIARIPTMKSPPWAQGEEGSRLAPLLLAGAWSEETDGDQQAIEALTRLTYAEVEGDLAAWSTQDDTPVYRSGRTWRLVSRDDVWDLVSPLVTRSHLDRFHEVAARILREPDPALDVEPSRRFMAAVVGKPPAHSARLRAALAETAAFLAGHVGPNRRLRDGRTGEEHADRVVRDVLDGINADITGRAWQSLVDVLPLLAEASPQSFLRTVEEGLRGDDPPVATLFMDSETASFPGITSPHIRLLGALMVACWSEGDLSRAAMALARLAAMDPEPDARSRPRPHGCLADVFSLWSPHTSAPWMLRLAILDRLRTRWPAVTWPLLLGTIPVRFAISPPPHRPRWRDWPEHPSEEITRHHLTAAVAEIVTRLLEDVGKDADRWSDLVAQLANLPDPDRGRILAGLDALDPGDLAEPGRTGLWRELTEFAQADRHHPGAMPHDIVGRVETLTARFAPSSPIDRHADLFNGHPRFIAPGVDSASDYDAAVREVRRVAIREVLDGGGVDDLLALGRAVTMPAAAGWAAGEIRGDHLADDLVPLLGADGPDGEIARGWAGARLHAEGIDWIGQRLERAGCWSAAQRAGLLLADPRPSAVLLALVVEQDEDVQSLFWRRMNPFLADAEIRSTVAAELADRGRPWSAIQVLVIHVGVSREDAAALVDIGLVEAVLERAAMGPSDETHLAPRNSWEAGRLLDFLEHVGSDPAVRARLEFLYIHLLQFSRPPRALNAALAADPALFADLFSYVHPAEADEVTEEQLTPERRAIAVAGFAAIRSWDTPPGVRADGTINGDHLRAWTLEARRLLADPRQRRVGDGVIGGILARAPADSDGVWPPAPVRDLIEEFESDAFDEGILSGQIDGRGVVSWSPTSGGDHGRALAEEFRDWAHRVADQPRTSALLRQLAAHDEAWARREDDQSQEFVDRDP
jgi:hypothetical protein